MVELYLILHRAYNEPAFDIAVRREREGEIEWVVPTSGHLATPFKTWPLSDFVDVETEVAFLPPNLRDLYPEPANREPSDLLTSLGLAQARQPLRRI